MASTNDHDALSVLELSPIGIGFVGCGTIASAIATGICSFAPSIKIMVSRRSESQSARLQATFPNQITVRDENQEIVDQSDVIFLCVLPQQTSEILQSLKFDPNRHRLVSLVATANLATLSRDSKLPLDRVSKMICLPAVARGEGMCLHCGQVENEQLSSLFVGLGGTIFTNSEPQLNALMLSTTLMGPIYGIMRQNQQWLVRQGIPEADAAKLIRSQYLAMVRDPKDIEDLIAEQTPGGLNEQALMNLQQMGVLDAFDTSMDATLARIEGRGDGTVPPD